MPSLAAFGETRGAVRRCCARTEAELPPHARSQPELPDRTLRRRLDRIDCRCDSAHNRRFARCAAKCFIRQGDEAFGIERRGKALQAQGGHFPVAVAPRAAQQIELTAGTLNERSAQLAEKLGIIACRRRKVGIDCIA